MQLFFCFFICGALAAQDSFVAEHAAHEPAAGVLPERATAGEATVPPPRDPRVPDVEKSRIAAQKDEGPDTVRKNQQTLEFGISDEIAALIKTFIDNDDPRYASDVYQLFRVTKSRIVRERAIEYFMALSDPCVADYAVTVLNDPSDVPRSTVSLAIRYCAAVKCTESVPALLTLIESDKEDYFNEAVYAVSEIGGAPEALYLTDVFLNGDNPINRKQTLMRALGKLQALETWDSMVDIAEDDTQNTFVRMYAAEAIGALKKAESVPVLVRLFEAADPNLRQYVIKGLRNFPDNDEAIAVIIQGIRDDYYRVRIESIQAVGEMNIVQAVPAVLYRAEHDKEAVVKKECWPVIAALNTPEGNAFLTDVLTDSKKSDSAKALAAEALLKAERGEDAVLAIAADVVRDDRRKPLRYSLGKALVKYARPSFASICAAYLASSDASTVAIGLELYRAERFPAAEEAVRSLAENNRAGANQKMARRILGITD